MSIACNLLSIVVLAAGCDLSRGGSRIILDLPALPLTLETWRDRVTWQISTSDSSVWVDLEYNEGSVERVLPIAESGAWLAVRPVFRGSWGERFGPTAGWVSGASAPVYDSFAGAYRVNCSLSEGACAVFLRYIDAKAWKGFNISRLCKELEKRRLTSLDLDYEAMCLDFAAGKFSLSSIRYRELLEARFIPPDGEWLNFQGETVFRPGAGEHEYTQSLLKHGLTSLLEKTGGEILDLYLSVDLSGRTQVQAMRHGAGD